MDLRNLKLGVEQRINMTNTSFVPDQALGNINMQDIINHEISRFKSKTCHNSNGLKSQSI